MNKDAALDLADCGELYQALQARPPRVVRGTGILLGGLLGTALLWAQLTRAALVVRAPCVVRPIAASQDAYTALSGEKVSTARTGMVAEVHYRIGSKVRQGHVLIRLDTRRIDLDMREQKRALAVGEEELRQLQRQRRFLARRYAVDKSKAEKELEQAREEVAIAREKQAAEITAAENELKKALHEEAQLRRLVPKGAAAQEELIKAAAQLGVARANLAKAQVRINDNRVRIFRDALDLMARNAELEQGELEMRQEAKRREVDAAKVELARLVLEREEMALYAPADGVVTTGDVRVGDVLRAGDVVLTVAPEQGFRVDVAVPSAEIGHVREGMPVRVKLDAYDYQRYGTVSGTVCQISPDSQMRHGQQEAIFIVQVALRGDQVGQGEYRGQVKLGMTGQAEIVIRQESLLALLVTRVRQTISLG
jgi:HlyD family secretion protein